MKRHSPPWDTLSSVFPGVAGMNRSKPDFWLGQRKARIRGVTLRFVRKSRVEFYQAAMAGSQDNGGPGLRPQYHPNCLCSIRWQQHRSVLPRSAWGLGIGLFDPSIDVLGETTGIARMDWITAFPWPAAKLRALVVCKCLPYVGLRVHQTDHAARQVLPVVGLAESIARFPLRRFESARFHIGANFDQMPRRDRMPTQRKRRSRIEIHRATDSCRCCRIDHFTGASLTVQIATSLSLRLAWECGGGGSGFWETSAPRRPRTSTPGLLLCGMCGWPTAWKVRIDHLVCARQIQPNLKRIDGISGISDQKRKHLGVLDSTRRQPLHRRDHNARWLQGNR